MSRSHPTRLLTAAAALGAVAVLGLTGIAMRERVLESWYLWKLDSEDRSGRERAASRLGAMRSVRAAPRLVELLASEEFEEDLDFGLHDRVYPYRDLREIGPAAIPAMLEAMVEGRLVDSTVFDLLDEFGIEAVPQALAALAHENPRLRVFAGLWVGELLGPQAPGSVLSGLRRALEDPVPDVRWAAVYALGRIGPYARPAAPDVIRALEIEGEEGLEEQELVARYVEALGLIGSEVAVPAVARYLESENSVIRHAAGDAMMMLALEADAAIPHLGELLRADALRGDNWDRRNGLIETLGWLGPRAAPAIAALLAQPDELGFVSLGVLSKIGAPAVGTLAELARAHPNAWLRIEATRHLENLGPRARDAVPALIAALGDSAPEVQEAAADALGAIGPEAREAVPALTQLLRTDPWRAVTWAVALGRIGPDAASAVPTLVETLERLEFGVDRGPIPPEPILAALGEIGPAAKPAAPLVREILARDEFRWIRRAAVGTLIGVEARDAESIATLESALEDEDGIVRLLAAQGLAKLEVAGYDFDRVLTEARRSLGENLGAVSRQESIRLLGACARKSRASVGVLLAALDNASLRLGAIHQLGEVGAGDERVVPELLGIVDGSHDGLEAARALEKLAPVDRRAAHGLFDLLRKNELPAFRPRIIEALTRADFDDENYIRLLVHLFDEAKDPLAFDAVELRTCAVDALGELGPRAASAVPALHEALTLAIEGEIEYRHRVLVALEKIRGVPFPEAVPR